MKVPKEIIIGVYKITNTITDKYYIGYATNDRLLGIDVRLGIKSFGELNEAPLIL